MSATLEVAIIFLILTLIVVFGFLLKLIIDSIKLVENLNETTTIIKKEIEPTLKEVSKTLENINSLTEEANRKLVSVRKLLSGLLGLSSITLGGFKNITGGFFKGVVEGIKFFTKK